MGNNQESSKMESGRNSNNTNKNENDISTVLVNTEQITVFKPEVWFSNDNKNN